MSNLIVGGAGFIGSNLAHRLAGSTIVDNLLTGSVDNVPEDATYHEMDGHQVGKLAGPWDAIFHLGGASSAPLFDADPLRASQAVSLFQAVLEVARQHDAPVAFASTSSFYARCPKPYREDMHVEAHTLYEASKLTMENLARAYCETYGLDVSAFRFFSVYGPREQGKGRFANIVSQFLWCLKAGIPPLVYGDGSQTRDFTHVDDLVDAMLLAYPETRGFEAYNIGTGIEHTFNQVLEKLRTALHIELEANYIPNPLRNYVQETQADASRLHALGWKPSIMLDEGIARLVSEEPTPKTVERMRVAHSS